VPGVDGHLRMVKIAANQDEMHTKEAPETTDCIRVMESWQAVEPMLFLFTEITVKGSVKRGHVTEIVTTHRLCWSQLTKTWIMGTIFCFVGIHVSASFHQCTSMNTL
jgi:hypothetical protein